MAALFPNMFFRGQFCSNLVTGGFFVKHSETNILNMLAMTHPWDESGIFIYMNTIKISHENVGKYMNPMDPMG